MSTPPKHPLPPRPDWATGLKAQPTLHPPRSRHDNNNNSRNMSPARPSSSAQAQNQSQQPQQLPPIFLQPTDFPPLSTVTNTDKRPSVGGAWTNPKSTARTILASSGGNSSQGQGASYGNARSRSYSRECSLMPRTLQSSGCDKTDAIQSPGKFRG